MSPHLHRTVPLAVGQSELCSPNIRRRHLVHLPDCNDPNHLRPHNGRQSTMAIHAILPRPRHASLNRLSRRCKALECFSSSRLVCNERLNVRVGSGTLKTLFPCQLTESFATVDAYPIFDFAISVQP